MRTISGDLIPMTDDPNIVNHRTQACIDIAIARAYRIVTLNSSSEELCSKNDLIFSALEQFFLVP